MVVLVFTLQSHTLVKIGKDILSICKHLENFLFSFLNTISGVFLVLLLLLFSSFMQQNMNDNIALSASIGFFFLIQFATCLRQFRCYSIDLFAVYVFFLRWRVVFRFQIIFYLLCIPPFLFIINSLDVTGCWCFIRCYLNKTAEFLSKFLSHRIKWKGRDFKCK